MLGNLFIITVFIAGLSTALIHIIYKWDLKNKWEWIGDCDFCIGFWLNTFLTSLLAFIGYAIEPYYITPFLIGYAILSPFFGAAVTRWMLG